MKVLSRSELPGAASDLLADSPAARAPRLDEINWELLAGLGGEKRSPIRVRTYDRLSPRIADQKGDRGAEQSDTDAMTDITREELDAKLEAIEARMDARVVTIGGKIDAFLAAQTERDKASEYRFQRIESDISEIKQSIGSSFGSMKNTLIVTAVSTVLAIVIGVAAFNATLTSNMLSAFQAGKAEATTPASPPTAAPQKP